MKKAKPKSKKGKKNDLLIESVKVQDGVNQKEEFDFGGFPKNVPFKRNLGCGG